MERKTSKSDRLANFLIDNLGITKTTKTSIYTEEGRKAVITFKKDIQRSEVLSQAGISLDWFYTESNDESRRKFLDRVIHKIREKTSTTVNLDLSMLPTQSNFDYTQFVPFLDVRTNKNLLFNSNTGKIAEVHYDSWAQLTPKDIKAQIPLTTCVSEYDPYNLESFQKTKFEGFEMVKVNTYSPPEWRLREYEGDGSCPRGMIKFFEHLIPNVACRNYVFSWIKTAILYRCETYLIMNGAKGIGKGIFSSLMRELVGRENYSESQSSFLNKDWTALLNEKRVITMDEVKVTKSNHSKLKKFINQYQNIEFKGQDATKPVETFNSFIISNNDLSDVYLEYDDRRFSVVDLCDIPLRDSMGADWAEKLAKAVDTGGDIITMFGHYIIGNDWGGVDEDSHLVYRGDRFDSIVLNSLTQWKKFILETVLSGERDRYDWKNLKYDFLDQNPQGKPPQNVSRVVGFFDNFRYGKDKLRIATMVKEDKDWYIVPNPELLNIGDVL